VKLKVISLGKIRQAFVRDGEAEFAKRIRSWVALELHELAVEKWAALPEPQLKEKEAELFLAHVDPDDFVVILDKHGKGKSSMELASFISTRIHEGQDVLFAIGGAYGWGDAAKKRANLLLSLSSLTFTYQMSRLILIEQIYRALTIIKHVPYHK
jgi:23S rRNA (pseudouridine1915-N3)-methyltransferase